MQHRLAYVGTDLQDLYGIDATHIAAATRMSDAYFESRDARATLDLLARTPDGILVSEETVKDFQLRLGDDFQSPWPSSSNSAKGRFRARRVIGVVVARTHCHDRAAVRRRRAGRGPPASLARDQAARAAGTGAGRQRRDGGEATFLATLLTRLEPARRHRRPTLPPQRVPAGGCAPCFSADARACAAAIGP
ncbi:hypothetical protein [Cupriavidus sp. BIC8F]|uniref:hypothetical protein n=1 Tax=Cupriavidus sp. BIC8F TaxID=3079014 RepID=UPI0029170DFE|nr:hypothetical protein [Cupriavidus sp. BIC8F]